jgi:mannosyltransferase OCH1-like enzyme
METIEKIFMTITFLLIVLIIYNKNENVKEREENKTRENMTTRYQEKNICFDPNYKDKKLKYIPKKIFQLCTDKTKLHKYFIDNIEYIKKLNPDWEHYLLDDKDKEEYLKKNYGPEMLYYYNRINPNYGAARADFFRYLLMYKEGGAYFDIKSAMKYPLSIILYPEDEYILTHWYYEQQADILNLKLGEYQQWHIICKPQHPYLRAVINKVINNIINYDEKIGTGKMAVLKTTGPIAYTEAIFPIKHTEKHREVDFDEMLGLIYNNLSVDHVNLFSQKHYSQVNEPVILNEPKIL